MRNLRIAAMMASALVSLTAATAVNAANNQNLISMLPQIGVRPFYLVEDMDAGLLKNELQECKVNS